MTIFIFEGPDGAGKSFTASAFAEAVGLPIHHFGGPPKSREEIIERAELIETSDNIIFDRVPQISDQVYNPVIRKEPANFTDKDLSFLIDYDEDDPAQKDYRVIYCRPSKQTITNVSLQSKPHKSQEHTDACKANIDKLISAYDVIMSKIPHIEFNRDYQDLEGLFRNLQKMI